MLMKQRVVVWVQSNMNDVVSMFFHDLKQYNNTNFKALRCADLSNSSPAVNKAFSSTITRYFIFSEKHPELSDAELRILYYRLKLDMVARYFSNYPSSSIDELRPFQLELLNYISGDSESYEC